MLCDITLLNEVSLYCLFQNNKMEAGKRPASFLSPSLVFSRSKPCAVRMALGGDGDHVPASIVQVINRVISQKQSLKEAISAPRVFSSLVLNTLYYEGKQVLCVDVCAHADGFL